MVIPNNFFTHIMTREEGTFMTDVFRKEKDIYTELILDCSSFVPVT